MSFLKTNIDIDLLDDMYRLTAAERVGDEGAHPAHGRAFRSDQG